MDQVQQKALNALEPYLVLAKSANSPQAATQVIIQATSAPSTFVFAELLHLPNIKKLEHGSSEHSVFYALLQIFSWGTWADYKSLPNPPSLSSSQAHKLKQLSLLSLSSTPHLLTYSNVQEVLSLSSIRELEDLVISTIYAGLITAKLDTLTQRIDVSSVAPLRDLKPASIPYMITVLDDWDKRCRGVLEELEEQVKEVRRKALKDRRREDANQKATARLMEDKDGKGKAGGKRGVGEEGDEMDVDESGSGLRTRSTKKSGSLMRSFGKRS